MRTSFYLEEPREPKINQVILVDNPYLKEYKSAQELPNLSEKKYTERQFLVKRYSWAVPDDFSVNFIAKYSPLIEIGAGTGYWASLIDKVGGDIICYDEWMPGQELGWFPKAKPFYSINRGGPKKLREHKDRTLFICWPPYDEPLALNCLKNYEGNYFIYIGEGSGGCTGCDDFHEKLWREWEAKYEYNIPKWDCIGDSLTIFKRREKPLND